ncbi:D-2-hydroxyacid dehydrogenase [Ectobacillus ponti]|uniref:D-2-hydroxyacid dehydrogenase n=1 Tax=Ectobacillus ponti TaxID=2961894 RepID=A0AA42BQY2_9BACI|nr:D-2-hydroxyacid dehydrogenase [Ectobacillus ponti]MCP8970377.1 D-2-hydroxyacid dehydrogenase [Ectobacillus ponti]
MTKRTLIITQNLDSALHEEVASAVPDWKLIVGRDRDVWLPYLEEAEVLAGWKTEVRDLCSKPSKLRWLQSWSAGVNAMPLQEMEQQGILLTSANGVHAYPISETIFALMLALTRNIHTYVRQQLQQTWHHGNLSLEIHGKTIGIIGVGAIGSETARLAKAFGMRTLGIRRSGEAAPYVDEMHTLAQLHTILPRCDYVVVTLPLTDETRQLFRAEQFGLMKPNAFFINIGRGELVAERDLLQALQQGEIAGAGLDVFEQEPLPAESPLWGMDNVIVTPHTAGSTEHYNERVIRDIFLPNLQRYLNGGIPAINLVDYTRGY